VPRTSQLPLQSDSRQLIIKIADQLLDLEANASELRAAAHQLYSLFSDVTGVGDSSQAPEDTRDTLLACGKALSPNDAARSILDYYRTAQFLRGTYAAIKEAQKRFTDRPIEILYAGCGPFAPFAIALATQFSPDEIQFTLLDINARSLNAAKQIVDHLNLGGFIRAYVQDDAACYQHPIGRGPHIVITETMQQALAKEPQVAIDLNLRRQLVPGGIFIPDCVAIDVCLSELSKEIRFIQAKTDIGKSELSDLRAGKNRIVLGRIFELREDHRRALLTGTAINAMTRNTLFDPVTIEIPPIEDHTYRLMLLTTITIFDTIVLTENTSGLTLPMVLHDLGTVAGGSRIEFSYTLGHQPGFRYRLLPN